jgi:KDO2-lipid IV(A) lauroyltransferase
MPQHGVDTPGDKFPWHEYRAPVYWPTRIGIGCVWLLSRLPFNGQLAVGRGLGMLLYYLLPGRRRITMINLRLAFPEQPDTQRKKLARSTYRHIGMGIAETACAWFRPVAYISSRFDLHGREHLDTALASGHGVILLQAHFTVLDLCAGVICSHWPAAAVYDKPKNPLFAAYMSWQRKRVMTELIDNQDIRSMIRRLRRGEIVWYSPDQSVSRSHGGIPTRYFDQPVNTTSGTARIVAMTGAVIIPYIPTRHADTGRYTLRFNAPLDIDSSDTEASTQAVNDLFEAQVWAQPEQYLWVHKRFKVPSGDYPDPYR